MATESEKLEIHLRDGGVLYTDVDDDVTDLNKLDDFIEDVVGGAPRWVWIGTAYVHNRAISAIAYVDEIDLSAPAVGLELAEELAQ